MKGAWGEKNGGANILGETLVEVKGEEGGAGLARTVTQAVVGDAEAVPIVRECGALVALVQSLANLTPQQACKGSWEMGEGALRAVSAVLTSASTTELPHTVHAIVGEGGVSFLMAALSMRLSFAAAAHCMRCLQRLVQGDSRLADEVARGCSPELARLLCVVEHRLGEETAKLLAALSPARLACAREVRTALAEQNWLAAPLALLLDSAKPSARQAGAAAVEAVVELGLEQAVVALKPTGAIESLLEMLTGRAGRQVAAEAFLSLARTSAGRDAMHELEWGPTAGSSPPTTVEESPRRAQKGGKRSRAAVTSALGRLLAASGARAAGGRIAAVRTLACLSSLGGADWQAEVPRRGRLQQVILMAGVGEGLQGELDAEVPDIGSTCDERIAAAVALAGIVQTPKVATGAVKLGAVSVILSLLRPVTSDVRVAEQVDTALRLLRALMSQHVDPDLLCRGDWLLSELISLLREGPSTDVAAADHAAAKCATAQTIAALLRTYGRTCLSSDSSRAASTESLTNAVATLITEANCTTLADDMSSSSGCDAASAALAIIPVLASVTSVVECLRRPSELTNALDDLLLLNNRNNRCRLLVAVTLMEICNASPDACESISRTALLPTLLHCVEAVNGEGGITVDRRDEAVVAIGHLCGYPFPRLSDGAALTSARIAATLLRAAVDERYPALSTDARRAIARGLASLIAADANIANATHTRNSQSTGCLSVLCCEEGAAALGALTRDAIDVDQVMADNVATILDGIITARVASSSPNKVYLVPSFAPLIMRQLDRELARERAALDEDASSSSVAPSRRVPQLLAALDDLPPGQASASLLLRVDSVATIIAVLRRCIALRLDATEGALLWSACAAVGLARRLSAFPDGLRALGDAPMQSALWGLLIRLTGRVELWARWGRSVTSATLAALLSQSPLDVQEALGGEPGDWTPDEVGEQLAASLAEMLCGSSTNKDVGVVVDNSNDSSKCADAESAAALISALLASVPRPPSVADERKASSERVPASFLVERLVMGGQAVPAMVAMLAEGRPESARFAAADCLHQMASYSELGQVAITCCLPAVPRLAILLSDETISIPTREATLRALAALSREPSAQTGIAASAALPAVVELLEEASRGRRTSRASADGTGSGAEAMTATAAVAMRLVSRLAGNPNCVGTVCRVTRLLGAVVTLVATPEVAESSGPRVELQRAAVATTACLATSELGGPALLERGALPAVLGLLFRQQIKATSQLGAVDHMLSCDAFVTLAGLSGHISAAQARDTGLKKELTRAVPLLIESLREQLSEHTDEQAAGLSPVPERATVAICNAAQALAGLPGRLGDHLCASLVACKAVPLLLSLLTGSQAQCDAALEAITALIRRHRAAGEAFVAAAGVEQLLALLEDAGEAAVRALVGPLVALAEGGSYGGGWQALRESGALSILFDLLSDCHSLSTRLTAAKALRALVSNASDEAGELVEAVEEVDGISTLLAMLVVDVGAEVANEADATALKVLATEILTPVVSGAEGAAVVEELLMEQPAFLDTVSDLVGAHQSAEQRKAGAHLIATLPLGGGATQQLSVYAAMTMTSGLMSVMKAFPEDENTVQHAIDALATLSERRENEPRIVKSGALAALLHTLGRGSRRARDSACIAVANLLRANAGNMPAVVAGGCVKAMTDIAMDASANHTAACAAVWTVSQIASHPFHQSAARDSGAVVRLLGRVQSFSPALRLEVLRLWEKLALGHPRWVLSGHQMLAPALLVQLNEDREFAAAEIDAVRCGLSSLAKRLAREGDNERSDILTAMLAWSQPRVAQRLSRQVEQQIERISDRFANSHGGNEVVALRLQALCTFLDASVETCVEMLKNSNWNLANTMEEVLQRRGDQGTASPSTSQTAASTVDGGCSVGTTAAPGARESPHVRFHTPPQTPERASSPYSFSHPKGTRSENVTPNRRRTASPGPSYSDPGGDTPPRRPSPSRYASSPSSEQKHGAAAPEHRSTSSAGSSPTPCANSGTADRPRTTTRPSASAARPMFGYMHRAASTDRPPAAPAQRSSSAGPPDAQVEASTGWGRSSLLQRAASAVDAGEFGRAAAAGRAAVEMERRIAERQAEVSSMLREREDLEASKQAIRGRVKSRLAKIEGKASLTDVLRGFGFDCTRETEKRVFRQAVIDLHPDKSAQVQGLTLEEAVRREEMFKILMSKKDLLR